MGNIPKVAPGGTNLLVRVLDANRVLIPDVLIEVVGLRGSMQVTPNSTNPADGVRFPGEKAWGFEDSEFKDAPSMTLAIRAFKPGSDFGPVPPGDVPDWSRFVQGIATIEMELVQRQDDFVDVLLFDQATARCLATLVIPPEQVVVVQPGVVRPTEYATVSHQLTHERARVILDFLHLTGQITLEASCAPRLSSGTCAVTPGPVGTTNIKLRGWLFGVRIITNLMGSKQFDARNPTLPKPDERTVFVLPAAVSNLDTRNAVALIRLIKDAKKRFDISEFLHSGIGAGNNAAVFDCHSEGRAVDFVGVRLPQQGTNLSTRIYIGEFWGTQSVPDIADLTKAPADPTRKPRIAKWPDGDFRSLEYRLVSRTDASMGVVLRRARQFWRGMWNMVIREYRSNDSNAQDIGTNGFVMHPDHPTSQPKGAGGREAHLGHLHFQIGETGADRATPAVQC